MNFKEIKKYHEEEDKEIELMSVVEQRLHRQRGELIQLVEEMKQYLMVGFCEKCSMGCGACRIGELLKKLE